MAVVRLAFRIAHRIVEVVNTGFGLLLAYGVYYLGYDWRLVLLASVVAVFPIVVWLVSAIRSRLSP